jgi:hypothetical protein
MIFFLFLELARRNNQHLKKDLVTCETTEECKEIFKHILKNFSVSEEQTLNYNNQKKNSNNRNMNLVTSGGPASVPSNGANTRKKPFKWGK